VLQGVAPFSWSGSAWQPSGRAGPGVPTPSGTLEGIALYTWNGSAWVPSGGGPGSPTPTGTLRGVAGFTWDGTAWQPSGQAGPDVATPFGVLTGMAMFSWSGTGWMAAPSLDLVFFGPTLDPRITFTRASTATYFDAAGVMQTAATNAPRFDYDPVTHVLRGLLIEEQRTNVLLNSATLGTQSVAVTAQAYTLSFYGTGTITLSGASTAGPLTGSGAFPARVSQTFTPTAGTLTLTVTGSVLSAQLEVSGAASSYIPTTGVAVTRSADQCSIQPANMGFFVSPGGSWFAEFVDFGTINTRIIGYLPAAGQSTPMFIGGSFQVQQFDGAFMNTANGIGYNTIMKAATTYAPGTGKACLNAGAVASAAMTTGFNLLVGGGVGIMGAGGPGSGENTSGYIRRVRYWPRVLSDAEMQAVTT
jgi:hypothetical protein